MISIVKRLFDFILSEYTNASFEIQKKARLLVICCVLFTVSAPVVFILFMIGNISPLISVWNLFTAAAYILSLILIKKNRFAAASYLTSFTIFSLVIVFCLVSVFDSRYILVVDAFLVTFVLIFSLLFAYRQFQTLLISVLGLLLLIIMFFRNVGIDAVMKSNETLFLVVSSIMIYSLMCVVVVIKARNTDEILDVVKKESLENREQADVNRRMAAESDRMNLTLKLIIDKVKEITQRLNSSSREILSAAQEQMTGAEQQASGITMVNSTMEELSITAKQITGNVNELVAVSADVIKVLGSIENRLLQTVAELKEVWDMSEKNTKEIRELGTRSAIINEMVELIKEIANKTNILSINASIEASRSGAAGSGFAVVASEIRELSKETIASAKNAEQAAAEIREFLELIIESSGIELEKVESGNSTVKNIYTELKNIAEQINNNYSFTRKIDVSIRQQETGSRQTSDTMRQMAEVAKQSAEVARQTAVTVKDIVNIGSELDTTVMNVQTRV